MGTGPALCRKHQPPPGRPMETDGTGLWFSGSTPFQPLVGKQTSSHTVALSENMAAVDKGCPGISPHPPPSHHSLMDGVSRGPPGLCSPHGW